MQWEVAGKKLNLDSQRANQTFAEGFGLSLLSPWFLSECDLRQTSYELVLFLICTIEDAAIS